MWFTSMPFSHGPKQSLEPESEKAGQLTVSYWPRATWRARSTQTRPPWLSKSPPKSGSVRPGTGNFQFADAWVRDKPLDLNSNFIILSMTKFWIWLKKSDPESKYFWDFNDFMKWKSNLQHEISWPWNFM
jgi:hypothetical protein